MGIIINNNVTALNAWRNLSTSNNKLSKSLEKYQIQNEPFPEGVSFSVDTRFLKKGDVFVALSGQRVDGHDFIQEALDKGAIGFVLQENKKSTLLKKYKSALKNKHLLFVWIFSMDNPPLFFDNYPRTPLFRPR